ncbi:MAG: hypothetical protein WA005_09650 [Candidatus Binataceae bacterium]
MTLPAEIRRYSRMMLGVFELARTPAIADPEQTLRRNLENRAANFLDVVARAVYANPENPYHKMLRLAQCEYRDMERAVQRDGLEPTLVELLRAGVYLTHDELKGKAPIIRSGELISAGEHSYDNPSTPARIETRSGGSRSKGTLTQHSVAAQIHWEQYQRLLARELGIQHDAFVALLPILPSISGLMVSLRGAQYDWQVEKWYALSGSQRDYAHSRAAATRAMILIGKMAGAPCTFPTYLPENDFSPVAEYIARRKIAGKRCCLGGFVSPAVRVAAAAIERGWDISGTVFSVGGEALTPAKRATMEAAGGEVYPFYAIVEFGPVGYACRRMKTGNCVHLFEDLVAAISRKRLAPLSETEVDSLLFTTLTPFASRALINAEMDDSGIIEKVNCDCLFGQLGYGRQIRDIASYGKLTGQGMTLAGTDVVRVLEETLPRRLGGSAGDYQLVEEEGPAQTVMTLRVSPRVGRLRPDEVRECFLEELKAHRGGTVAASTWRHAEGVKVIIAEPLATPTGKVLPLHLLGGRKSD